MLDWFPCSVRGRKFHSYNLIVAERGVDSSAAIFVVPDVGPINYIAIFSMNHRGDQIVFAVC